MRILEHKHRLEGRSELTHVTQVGHGMLEGHIVMLSHPTYLGIDAIEIAVDSVGGLDVEPADLRVHEHAYGVVVSSRSQAHG